MGVFEGEKRQSVALLALLGGGVMTALFDIPGMSTGSVDINSPNRREEWRLMGREVSSRHIAT